MGSPDQVSRQAHADVDGVSKVGPHEAPEEQHDEASRKPRVVRGSGMAGVGGSGSGPGRKPKACLECKKLKMKCEVFPGDHKCKHCLRRKTDCVFKKTRQAAYVDVQDGSLPYGETCEKRMDQLWEEMKLVRESLDGFLSERRASESAMMTGSVLASTQGNLSMVTPSASMSPAGLSSTREANTQMAMTRENSVEPAQNHDAADDAVTVEEPMGSLYEVTRLRNIRSNKAKTARPATGSQGELNDFISRGVISEPEAEELYNVFHKSLNHYLWVGLEQTHPSFYSIRKSSELLTATILAVTALHIPTSAETFDRCYKEFLGLISSSMFSRYHSIDDVRGLCIAAFWLSDVSWKLSGHAIRIATELNIHQSFAKALEGDREHFLRARLWYMLYVCDHHFSIAYGRPPMTAESIQIREHELFLESPFADAIDYRVLSQVALMQILTRVYERFAERRLPDRNAIRNGGPGAGAARDPAASMLSEDDFADVRTFNLQIEQWRITWYSRQRANSFIGKFPMQGINLYSYFAKLQLNILAVRGVSLDACHLSTERRELANMAISAASSILTFVLEEEDMRRALVGTPLYVHMMIAFASVFLMKVATKWNRIMGFNIEHSYANVSRLLEQIIALLKNSVTSERHVLYHIAGGLEKMLARMTAEAHRDEQQVLLSAQGRLAAYGTSPMISSGFGAAVQGAQLINPSGGWGCTVHGQPQGGDENAGDFLGDGTMPFVDEGMLQEAFGVDASGNDVYSLLSNQFN